MRLGNKELALETSQEYLELTKGNFDKQTYIDMINNLVFLSRLWRDRPAQDYLADALVELENTIGSAVSGLSEFRIAQSRNDMGQYGDGLEFSQIAQEKANIELLVKQAKISEAIALVGLSLIHISEPTRPY